MTMRRWLLCSTLALAACKPNGGPMMSDSPLNTDTERTLYALGLILGQRVEEFSLTPSELAVVQRGLTDRVTGAHHPRVVLSEWSPRVSGMAQERQGRRAEQEKVRGRQFADQSAQESGAQRLPSGLVFRMLHEGTGPTPTPSDRVRVHYRGTLRDGTEFDSSYSRGEPMEFSLGGVIPCWTDGLQRVRVGGKARLVCASEFAYGDRGQRGIPPGATLSFEVELLAIVTPSGDAGR